MPQKTQQQLRAEGFTQTQGTRGGGVEVWEKPGPTSAHDPTVNIRDPDTGDILEPSEMPETDPDHAALRVWLLQRRIKRMETRLVAVEAALSIRGGR